MPVKPQPPKLVSSDVLALVLDQLACPACLSDLRMDGPGLTCTACARVYPVVDGIPVLIAGRADSESLNS